jgi:hypothetical protein
MLIILCDLKHHLFAFVIRHMLGKNPSLFGELAPVLRLIERRTVQKSPHRYAQPKKAPDNAGDSSELVHSLEGSSRPLHSLF